MKYNTPEFTQNLKTLISMDIYQESYSVRLIKRRCKIIKEEDGGRMIKEKAEKLIEAIRHNRSPESIVCDSVMRCEGWKQWAHLINPKYIGFKKSFKFCPCCGKEIKWEI